MDGNRWSGPRRLRIATALLACAMVSACSPAPNPSSAAIAPTAPNASHATTGTPSIALLPLPASLEVGKGQFRFDATTTLMAGDGGEQAARAFSEVLARTTAVTLPVRIVAGPNAAGASNAIVFRIDPAAVGTGAESYTLDVRSDGASVTARDTRGLFYGAMTLWQLLVPAKGPAASTTASTRATPLQAPVLHIQDAPRFAWRGLMLDSARHFQSIAQIKQLLDAMAIHKLNTFHWHLTDDQGWRIEIKRYPKLTSIGSCRIPAGDGGIDAATGKPAPYCGFYTQEQIREVVAYAAARQITVVPEIDMPGHAQAAVAAYPELGVLGTQPPVSNEWGVNTYLFNTEPETIAFLHNVLAEVVTLFPGHYIHVGGDEAVKDQWKASARVQAHMRRLGLEDEMQMQSWFIRQVEAWLVAHDRKLIGWDEILQGGLPPSATVMSWQGAQGAVDAATQGHDVVMAPVAQLYMDYLQTDSPNEPPGRPATITLQQVYAFDPIPAGLAVDKQAHIIGVQANTWTEHMRSFARVQHAMFPRIAALAEIAWSPAAARDWPGFVQRLPAQLRRYRLLGIDYATTPFEVVAKSTEQRGAGSVDIALSNRLGFADMRYTLDGSAPTARSTAYIAPLHLPLPVDLHAAVFVDGQPLVAPGAWKIDAASLLQRRDEDLAMCTSALMLRLEDDGPRVGERAIFNADIFNPCWSWKGADLDGIAAIEVRAGRLPYYFQLAHDEPSRTFKPARSAHGELEIHAGCDGPLLGTVPLPEAPGADGFVTLLAPLAPLAKGPASGGVAGPAGQSTEVETTQDLCIWFTGDTRPTMWVLDSVRLVPR